MKKTILRQIDISDAISEATVGTLTDQVMDAVRKAAPDMSVNDILDLRIFGGFDEWVEIPALETDGEYADRLEKERKREQQDRKLYEELKKKFEG